MNIIPPSTCKPMAPLPFGYEDSKRGIGVNTRYLTRNDQPWYPVMGEFHFSRIHPDYWKQGLRKMRAGGVSVAATYVFWIHHEEEQGVWDFSGMRDLRRFLNDCRELDFPVILRIGPWAHGECRNGGFPDWLAARRDFIPRTDDLAYLELVRSFWKQIFVQTSGMLWKEGGPVVGIQLENEFGHCGGPNGDEAKQHLCTLKRMAQEIGFDVPLYTATGWGGAAVVDGETIPVLGAYCDAPWAQHLEQMPANANYIFSYQLGDVNIGSDLQVNDSYEFTYDTENNPYLTAELGGGLQVTAHRRTVATAQDTLSLALCKLGSGANLLGYYMYHGGTNPKGRLSTLQESRATGYPNDVPVLSYDFQAPVGEFGRVHETFYRLNPLHLFLKEFGDLLAPCVSEIPAWSAQFPEDLTAPRVAVRHDPHTGGGFLCVNHYQRHRTMNSGILPGVTVQTQAGDVHFPDLPLTDGFCAVLPYHLKLGDAVLGSTNAQLLCRLGNSTVFFTDLQPEYRFEQGQADILTLTRRQAEHAFKIGGRLYVLESGYVLEEDNQPVLYTECPQNIVTLYPENQVISACCAEISAPLSCTPTEEADGVKIYELRFCMPQDKQLEELWLCLDVQCDRAELYAGEELAADWFYTGLTWTVGTRQLPKAEAYTLKLYPVHAGVYYDIPPVAACELTNASLCPEYRIPLE